MITILFALISYSWAAPQCEAAPDSVRATRNGLGSAIQSADRLRTHPERFVVASDKFAEVDRAARTALNLQAEETFRALQSCASDCIQVANRILQSGSLLFDAISFEIDCSSLDQSDQNLKDELKLINVQIDHILQEVFLTGIERFERSSPHLKLEDDLTPICRALRLRVQHEEALGKSASLQVRLKAAYSQICAHVELEQAW